MCVVHRIILHCSIGKYQAFVKNILIVYVDYHLDWIDKKTHIYQYIILIRLIERQ